MKLKDLLAKVKDLDPEMDVVVWSDSQERYTDTDVTVSEVVEDEDGTVRDMRPGDDTNEDLGAIRKVVSFTIQD